MQQNQPAPAPALPPGLFSFQRAGYTVDLTPYLLTGAKHTVLYTALANTLGIPAKIPSHRPGDPLKQYAKHNEFLYRLLNRWAKIGLLEKLTKAIDTTSIDPTQRPGIFWRATQAAYETPYLIDGMQNSKSFAEQTSTLNDETSDKNAKHLIPDHCGHLRQLAIKTLSSIRNPDWFIRDPKTKHLNKNLEIRLDRVNKFFTEWDEESSRKIILLKNLKDDTYTEIPYKTRFNDKGRKLANIKIYNTGIENSLKKHQDGIFLTLTTDPKIWMTKKDEPFVRHIKNQGKTKHLPGTGQGGDLYQANRHESEAWRKWYEKICHRNNTRVPYIRCVEFQKNGLIHTHVLLFGINWSQSWDEFAEEWGTRYHQGYLNKAYKVTNDGTKWTWKDKKPEDTKGRDPSDYLKKYLIKSMYETDGFYMYWACNKRFFTMSESLRYYSFDEKIAEEDWLKLHARPETYEFVGAAEPELIPRVIEIYERKKYGRPEPARFTGTDQLKMWPGTGWLHNSYFEHAGIYNIENPDENDPAETPPNSDYDMQLEAERIARAERRRKRRDKKTGESS